MKINNFWFTSKPNNPQKWNIFPLVLQFWGIAQNTLIITTSSTFILNRINSSVLSPRISLEQQLASPHSHFLYVILYSRIYAEWNSFPVYVQQTLDMTMIVCMLKL